MEITISVTIDLKFDDEKLTGVLSIMDGADYWAKLRYDRADYTDAKAHIEYTDYDDSPCFEEVLLQLLKDRKALQVLDYLDGVTYDLTLESLLTGIRLYAQNVDIDYDNWDIISGDYILQYAVFGEPIYG